MTDSNPKETNFNEHKEDLELNENYRHNKICQDHQNETQRSDSKTWKAPNAERYEKVFQVGEGAYGKVYKAKDKTKENKYVALKCILMDFEKEGFPITAMRELMILKNLKHDNIVNLIEIVSTKVDDKTRGNVYLVFEYMNHDLLGILKKGIKFKPPTIKSIFLQCLKGVNYLHNNNILHRDIKSANVLISDKGEVKIGDFGLARKFNPNIPQEKNRFTNNVVTLWYRAPEILLGAKNYNFLSDVWSLGCMFVEIIIGYPPFMGQNEASQIQKIFEICGTPIVSAESTEASTYPKNCIWPEFKEFKEYENFFMLNPIRFFPNSFERSFKEKFP